MSDEKSICAVTPPIKLTETSNFDIGINAEIDRYLNKDL